MAITDYASLSASIGTWATRTYTSDQTDEFMGLAEAEFRRILAGYERETTSTLSFTSGAGTLPTGVKKIVSLSYSPYGPLEAVTTDALAIMGSTTSGIPSFYAVSGTGVKLDRLLSADLSITYAETLTGLSASNPTNWLLDAAPDAYLFMCKAYQRAFEEEFEAAAGFKSQAKQMVKDLNLQSIGVQYGNARLTPRGATP